MNETALPGENHPSAERPDRAPVPLVAAPASPPPRTEEVEAKWTVEDPATLDALVRLEALGGAYRLRTEGLALITDAYYDTRAHDLLRRGLVLRLRHADGRTVVGVKGLARFGFGAIHRRLEIEGPVLEGPPPLDPAAWPAAVRERVVPILGPEAVLVPLCFLEHARHRRTVWPAAAAPGAADREAALAELSVEKVTVMEPDRTGWRHGAPELAASFAEVELESSATTAPDAFEAMVAPLGALDGLTAADQSKLERAIRLIAAHPPGRATNVLAVQPDMPMAEAGRLVWRQQLAEVLLCEGGARQGRDIEYVHDMRVATRRARAAARLFGPYFARKALRPFVDGLRQTGRALGPVRDLDVALDKLRRFQKRLPPDEVAGLDLLAQQWREARDAAYEQLVTWLDSRPYERFLTRLDAFCATPGHGALRAEGGDPGARPVQVRHVMPVAILERFAVIRAHEVVLERASPPADEVLHAIRIDCKGLRYALEAVRHLLGPEGETLITHLKRLQDHLGDLNDAVVTAERLRRMQREGADHPAVGRYLAVQEEAHERLRATFPEVWQGFVGPENRALVLAALARL